MRWLKRQWRKLTPEQAGRVLSAAHNRFVVEAGAAVTLCDGACSNGTKDADTLFRDAEGRILCSYCGRWSCERGDGNRRCDERLIYPKKARAERGQKAGELDKS
jgi:hypothetical protein